MTAKELLANMTDAMSFELSEDVKPHVITAMELHAFHVLEMVWDELVKNRQTTGFTPEADKVFVKYLAELKASALAK